MHELQLLCPHARGAACGEAAGIGDSHLVHRMGLAAAVVALVVSVVVVVAALVLARVLDRSGRDIGMEVGREKAAAAAAAAVARPCFLRENVRGVERGDGFGGGVPCTEVAGVVGCVSSSPMVKEESVADAGEKGDESRVPKLAESMFVAGHRYQSRSGTNSPVRLTQLESNPVDDCIE